MRFFIYMETGICKPQEATKQETRNGKKSYG